MDKAQLETDVLVIGGGSAGIAAAIAAARNGSRVILIEKNAQFGGKATSAVVGTICGAHFRSSDPESRYVTQGFAKEFCEAVATANGTKAIHHYQGDLHFLPYKPFAFALVADRLIRSENNIHCFFHSVISDIILKGDEIQSVEFINYREKIVVTPKAVIDCTGESTVSALGGLPTYKEKFYQASAMVFSLENITSADPVKLSLNIIRAVKKAIADREVPSELDKVSIVPGSVSSNSLMVKIALPYIIDDHPDNKSRVEQLGREAVHRISAILIERVSFFKNAHIGFVAPEVGTRTGQLSQGKYRLTKEDVLSCRKFEDGIAKAPWPIELWKPGYNAEMQFFPEDDYYEIPSGCLISPHLRNLYFSGRQISAEQEAIASARVIGTCLSTGFAAGILASFSAQQRPENEAIQQIRKTQIYR